GLLLRRSLSILAARVRHLFSAASTAAFSVASRLSNSSDILLADIFRAAPTTVGRLVRAPGSKLPGPVEAMASRSKFLAQMNKTQDVGGRPGNAIKAALRSARLN